MEEKFIAAWAAAREKAAALGIRMRPVAPEEAMKNCPVPVIFFHGDADDFVPSWMSQRNYEACSAPKELVIVPGAGHGLCYPVDPDGYLKAMAKFFTENGVPTQILGD